MIKVFEDNLKLLLLSSSSSKENDDKSNGSQHIFHSILNYVIKNSDSSKKLDYLMLFYNYEKILDYSRKKDYNICEYYLNRVSEYHDLVNFTSELEEQGLKSLYNPTIAYYHYSRKQYNEAMIYMNSSIKNIDFLINSGFKDAVFMKVEQCLNSFRLLYEMHDYESAILVASELLSYIINQNEIQDFCIYTIDSVIVNDFQYIKLFSLFIDSIIYKVIRQYSRKEEIFNSSFLHSLVTRVSNNVQSEIQNQIVKNSIEILQMIFIDKCQNELVLNKKEYFNDSNIPNSVKYLLVEYLLMLNPKYSLCSQVEPVVNHLLAHEKYRLKYLN